jgi:RluA family pseudouridine synthase
MAERIAARHKALRMAATPLPGSVPLENRRPIHVSAAHDKWTLRDLLCASFPHVSADEWRKRCEEGRFVSYGGKVREGDHIVRAGERILQVFPPEVEPEVSTDIRVIHEDDAVLVVQKPAPLPMHASGRFHRNTLQYLLNQAYAPKYPRPVHRLDANTTGLVLFARTRHCCRMLQRQFIEGTVEKTYLVRAVGHPAGDRFTCDAPISPVPGLLGTHVVDEADGLVSRTDFEVLTRNADGTALLRATLHSGRTNQIRVHLWEMGHPACGDMAYLTDGRIGETQTLEVDASPLMLHAWRLAFTHPATGERMEFETVRPDWAGGS